VIPVPDDIEVPFICICDEEWCTCMNMVAANPEACAECAAGHHLWELGGERTDGE